MHKQYFEGIPPLVSSLDTTKKEELLNQFSAIPDDLILFVIGHHAEVNKTLDHLRTYVAHELGLIDNCLSGTTQNRDLWYGALNYNLELCFPFPVKSIT
ncbi:hypothetical protein BC332_16296 [Capsicum chinense]|nr:hypothetical protein BC332_16296 [Capsicum chinense]